MAQVELTARMEARVGLQAAAPGAIRRSDRTATSTMGDNLTGGYNHQQGMAQGPAAALFNKLPAMLKNHPGDTDTAIAISQLAQYAQQPTPDGCAAYFTRHHVAPPAASTIYVAPGGFIFDCVTHSNNFIRFLDANQDNGHRVRWRMMTGMEQMEWYRAFERCQHTHLRVPHETLGLRGTNIHLLTTRNELHQAAEEIAPSLLTPTRIPAPADNHPVDAQQWRHVRRNLDYLLF